MSRKTYAIRTFQQNATLKTKTNAPIQKNQQFVYSSQNEIKAGKEYFLKQFFYMLFLLVKPVQIP